MRLGPLTRNLVGNAAALAAHDRRAGLHVEIEFVTTAAGFAGDPFVPAAVAPRSGASTAHALRIVRAARWAAAPAQSLACLKSHSGKHMHAAWIRQGF